MSNHFNEKHNLPLSKKITLIGQCETAVGMMSLQEILSEAVKDYKYLECEAFVFGSDDYLASIGKFYWKYKVWPQNKGRPSDIV